MLNVSALKFGSLRLYLYFQFFWRYGSNIFQSFIVNSTIFRQTCSYTALRPILSQQFVILSLIERT